MSEKLIIVDTVDKSQMEFGYPEDIDMENNPNYASENILGRATPMHQFVSGGARPVSIPLKVFWEKDEKEVEKKLSWLESLTYPQISDTGDIEGAPHPVLLVMGEFFRNNVYIVVRVNKHYHTKFDLKTGLPCFADINLELELHKKINVNYKTVRRFQ